MINKKISVTIPAYNEEATIEEVFINAYNSIKKITNTYEIFLLDDGSWDNTGKIMDRLKKKYGKNVTVIHHKKNKGFSGAMKTCYENATGDYIFLGPADGQFNYEELNIFTKEISKADVVVAYRITKEYTLLRRLNPFFFHLFARVLFDIKLKEFSSCILYSKKVRDSITITADPYSCLFLPEFIYKAMKKRYIFKQVPINFYKRKGGKQKGTNPKMILKTFKEMFRFWIDIQRGNLRY